jgi:hypothetical protein
MACMSDYGKHYRRGKELMVMGHDTMICFLLNVLLYVYFDAFSHTALR